MTDLLSKPTDVSASVDEQSRRLAQKLSIETADDLSSRNASPRFIEQVPIAYARRHQILGLEEDHGRMIVAVADLADPGPLDVVSRFLSLPVEPILVSPEQIIPAINAAYQQRTGQARAAITKTWVTHAIRLVRLASGMATFSAFVLPELPARQVRPGRCRDRRPDAPAVAWWTR